MQRSELGFERPASLQATTPPESRGLQRDAVRLLVSRPDGHTHTVFHHLADFLQAGDLLVVNQSATLPASLPAYGLPGEFLINLSTAYGDGVWLVEPRWSSAKPGPLPLEPGQPITVAGQPARLLNPYPGLERLWFLHSDSNLQRVMQGRGEPIRYGYVQEYYPLTMYQTIFAQTPGSAEMPSAGRPFTPRVLVALQQRGVQLAGITLHTGVSSLEVEAETVEAHPMYAEPFDVPVETAQAVNAAHTSGQRVIAVGTTVVRALEAAWDGKRVCPARGFTRIYIHPERGAHTVHGLLTGFHDPFASHLALLYAVAGQELIRAGYAAALQEGYLWHEFGDSHLILTR